jgi:hypothetical protein
MNASRQHNNRHYLKIKKFILYEYICFLKDFAKFFSLLYGFFWEYYKNETNKIPKKEPGEKRQEDLHGKSRKDLLTRDWVVGLIAVKQEGPVSDEYPRRKLFWNPKYR